MFKKLLKTTALLGAASSLVYASKKYKDAPCYLGRCKNRLKKCCKKDQYKKKPINIGSLFDKL